MKKVVIATNMAFWRYGAGDCSRLLSVANYLKQHTDLVIVYGGLAKEQDDKLLGGLGLENTVVMLEKKRELSYTAYARLFEQYIAGQNVDVCIIEHIELSFLLDYLPATVRVVLDTHDIVSERVSSFRAFNYKPLSFTISESEEYKLYGRYDGVVMINELDYDKVKKVIGPDKTILAAHPPVLRRRRTREKVSNIGYVASAYPPNVDAIMHFIKEVWTGFDGGGILNIYGMISNVLNLSNVQGVALRGYVPDYDSLYDEIDIAINPVRFGAGLKIKSVEAIGNGLPLVTTSHGARGLAGAGEAYLVADEPADFSRQLHNLINDFALRKRISDNAFNYASRHFSTDACFTNLLSFING
jgi:glycosyltransferase involved in cell wall biosynthesis